MTLSDFERVNREATQGGRFVGYWSGQCHIKHEHGTEKDPCVYDPERHETDEIRSVSTESRRRIACGASDEYGCMERIEDARQVAACDPAKILALCAAARALKHLYTAVLYDDAQVPGSRVVAENAIAGEAVAQLDAAGLEVE